MMIHTFQRSSVCSKCSGRLEDLSRSSCSFMLGVLKISEELMDVKEVIV
jgi:hypothetical protein